MTRPFAGAIPITIVVLTVAACASLRPIPPIPPAAVTRAESTKEYRWNPPVWTPGVKLTYNVVTFSEKRSGGAPERQVESARRLFEALDRTSRGHVRVRFSDNNHAIAEIHFDDRGRIIDAVPSRPEYAPLVTLFTQLADLPMMRAWADRRVVRGEKVLTTVDPQALIPASLAPAMEMFGKKWEVEFEYLGEYLLQGRDVVAFRGRIGEVIPTPHTSYDAKGTSTTIERGTMERIEYFDPGTGFSVASYETFTVTGRIGQIPTEWHTIESVVLDGSRSRGI